MWDWLVWVTLLVAICSAIAAMVVVLVRVRDALRNGKRVYARAVASLDTLTAKAELAAAKAERVGDNTRELEESVARLRRSIAQLAVLRAALAELDESFGWLRVLL